jgi:hypothetical protein
LRDRSSSFIEAYGSPPTTLNRRESLLGSGGSIPALPRCLLFAFRHVYNKNMLARAYKHRFYFVFEDIYYIFRDLRSLAERGVPAIASISRSTNRLACALRDSRLIRSLGLYVCLQALPRRLLVLPHFDTTYYKALIG